MTYNAYVTKIKDIRPHTNADRLQVATVFESQVVVGLEDKIDDIVIFFPSDGRLSHDYCKANNLFAIHDESGKKIGGGYFEDNRRVRVQKFRGERSDGYIAPLSSLSYLGKNKLKEGDIFTEVNGKLICEKFVTANTAKAQAQSVRTAKRHLYPMFKEHIETDQLIYKADEIKNNSTIIITEKLHGTSGRTGYVTKKTENWLTRWLAKFGIRLDQWEYITGSHRAVLDDQFTDSWYKDTFRKEVHDTFVGKLYRGETVYYEIVGFTNFGTPIMNIQDTAKMKDKAFTARWGKQIIYRYGCQNGHDVYIYRMTMTNEDGHSVEYSWDKVQSRARELGMKTVPEFVRFVYNGIQLQGNPYVFYEVEKKSLTEYCTELADGASTVDQSHIKEGVVLRIEHTNIPEGVRWMKFKSFEFRVLEDILKEQDLVDTEESQ